MTFTDSVTCIACRREFFSVIHFSGGIKQHVLFCPYCGQYYGMRKRK